MSVLCSFQLLLCAFAIAPLVTGASPGSHVLARRQSDFCSVESYFQQNPNLTPECVMRINSTLSLENFADALRVGFCDPTCSPSYLDFISTCFGFQGPSLVEYYVLHCGTNNGVACYSLLQNVDADINAPLNGTCASALVDPSTCTTQCTAAVRNVRNTFGCCVNNLFNTTYFRLADPVATLAVSYEFWDECGVETIGYCPVDPVFRRFLSPAIATNTETTSPAIATNTETTAPPGGGDNHGMRMVAFDKLLYVLVFWGVLMITFMM